MGPRLHRQAWSWVKRHNPLRKSRSTTVHVASNDSAVGISDNVRILVTKGRPVADASQEAWVEYWESLVEALGKRVDWANEDFQRANKDLSERLTAEHTERVAADAELAERVRSWLGGERGRGLTIAWWGVLAALVGSLLQGIAGIGG
jgi:hypothetical protein